VCDVPSTEDLDLAAVSTPEELFALLRTVHVRADSPSLRTLEARTRHDATPLSKTVVAEMLKGRRFPRKAVMISFLRACGVRDDHLDGWRHAWDRLAEASSAPASRRFQLSGPSESGHSEASSRRAMAGSSYSDASPDAPATYVRSAQIAGSGLADDEDPVIVSRKSFWHFSDDAPITLASYRLPPHRLAPYTNPEDLNYSRLAGLADLDALMDFFGAVRAYNPESEVRVIATHALAPRDVSNHLIIIGGLAWQNVTPWFSRMLSIPIESGDPFERHAIVVHGPDGEETEFGYTVDDGVLVEDTGYVVCGDNPSAPGRTLTICGGITTRGVQGAARCFMHPSVVQLENNRFLMSRLRNKSAYCLVMRILVAKNGEPLIPDLSREENRLFEWSAPIAEASRADAGTGR